MGKTGAKEPPIEDGAKITDVDSEQLIDKAPVSGEIPKPTKGKFGRSDLIVDDETEEDEEEEDEEEEEEEAADEDEDDEPGRIDPCMEEEAKKFLEVLKKVQSRCLMQKYFLDNRRLFSAPMSPKDIKAVFVEGPMSDILRGVFTVKEQPIPADPVMIKVDESEWIIHGNGQNMYRIDVEDKSITVFTYEIISNDLVESLFDVVVNTQNLKDLAEVKGLTLEELTKGNEIMAMYKGMQAAKELQEQQEGQKKADYGKMFG